MLKVIPGPAGRPPSPVPGPASPVSHNRRTDPRGRPRMYLRALLSITDQRRRMVILSVLTFIVLC